MTQMMMNIDAKGSIFFDCRDHAEDREICAMVSTICNMLIVACKRFDIEPKEISEGDIAHVCFDIPEAPEPLMLMFKSARDCFCELEDQFPFRVKVY